MSRCRRKLDDRLAALENANRASRWHFTLTDGTPASLPIGTVLDAIADAMDRTDIPAAEQPPVSGELALLARVDDSAETSMLGNLASQLARQAVEGTRNAERAAG